MRILLTTDTVGGVWTFSREVTRGLLSCGQSVALVSFGRPPSQPQLSWVAQTKMTYGGAFRYVSSEVPLEWMEANKAAYSGGKDLLCRLAEEFNADLVHANQFCFGALPLGIPKLVTAHSDVKSWASACRPGALDLSSDWFQQYQSLVCAGLEGADLVVAPSRWMLKALRNGFEFDGRTEIVLNGRTIEAPPTELPRYLQAVSVGRLWDEGKGLSVLNEVDACMPILLVGENTFAGAGAPDLKSTQYLGSLEEESVLETFRKCSLYLATSIYEPFGLAPLEAALCGCGVLARGIPSLREVWGNAAEFFHDADELSGLLLRLKNSPDALKGLQSRSLHRALELSADRMVTRYLAIYERLLPAVTTHGEIAAYAV